MNSSERGSSLIEMLGVICIIGTITVMMMGGISITMGRFKITQANRQVNHIVKDIRNAFSADVPTIPQTGKSAAKQLFDAGILDKSDVSTDDSGNYAATTVYGSEMDIRVSPSDGEDAYFTITYKDMPSGVCIDLLQLDFGDDPSDGLKSISVSGSESALAKTTFDWNSNSHKLMPQMAQIVEACKSSRSDITWKFYL